MELIRRYNPVAFRQRPISIILCATYISLFAGLLYTHHVVPQSPRVGDPVRGINLTEAWSDLQRISTLYHPYNSHENDGVRAWLIERIKETLNENQVDFEYVHQHWSDSDPISSSPYEVSRSQQKEVVIFDDNASNATFARSREGSTSVYFEGSNIIVYVKGSAAEADIPSTSSQLPPSFQSHCVLINAHFDSVSTGFGATDDGVGVVTILQLIKHYTTPHNKPGRCFIALLNNGEEDYLNGARAFAEHLLSDHIDVFLNLDGAGAGGRAVMFRSTDSDITKAYKKSPYPFGTAASADGFRQGVVKSQTDYVVFNEDLGYRGIDVAFMEPRSRYHTISDSTQETSLDSVWHMLSAALATTESLLSSSQNEWRPYKGSEAVFFDLFGRILGLIDLTSLIDASAALIAVGPILIVLVGFLLATRGKFYVFAAELRFDPLHPGSGQDETVVKIGGRRGILRTPVAFVVSVTAAVAIALLISHINPFIVYSSPYAVWT